MINDTEQNEKSQKKLTKRGYRLNNGQKIKNTFSNILKTFFFFIKKTFPIISKISICSDILKRLSVLFKRLLQKISVVFPSHNPQIKLKKSAFGYVLILFIGLLPFILYGTKYILDNRTLLNRQSEGTDYMNKSSLSSENLIKQCAQEIALAVAKKWNPALSYYEQRESLLRIADEIYNNSPTYVDTLLNKAISKIDIPKESSRKGTTYEPINITKSAENRLSPSLKQISRTSKTTNMRRYYYWYRYDTKYAPMALYHFHIMYQSLARNYDYGDMFSTDDDIYRDYCYYADGNDPITAKWYHYVTLPEVVGMSPSDGSSNVSTKEYTTRTNLNDNTVTIKCEFDKIKVTADNDVAYAVPAECNVDIILTVPTNNAALNKDNRDKNTTTTGTPYVSTSTTPTNDAKSTPICQITRAYQTFLKNFFYTRGVNVGVIPYSGNVSLYKNRSEWVKAPDKFDSSHFLQGSSLPMIVGAMMYGTKGTANADLTSIGDYSGSDLGYGLLCRGITGYFKGSTITAGDLLSTENPSNYKFRKQVYNPCYVGNANLLSMKSETTGSKYWMNPYFILELRPDVKFVYNLLNAFYPYYDDKNVSNFIFIPITWANNLLQDWDSEPYSTVLFSNSSLSTPSKTYPGRKKALILVVNKPDWFEPGELTYLGFNNDFSEIPMIESDCIRGDIDYSDTTQKFADGSSFNGTIQGMKKILKLEKQSGDNLTYTNGFYECKNGKYRLTFPEKGTVTLRVATADPVKFVAVASSSNSAAYSTDGINWKDATLPFEGKWNTVCYGNGKFVAIAENSDRAAYSTDGINWEQAILPLNTRWKSVCFGKDKFVALSYSGQKGAYSSNGIDWHETSSMLLPGNWYSVCFGKDRFVAIRFYEDNGAYSSNGIDWNKINTMPTTGNRWASVCYGNDKFVAVANNSNGAYSSDGIDWNPTTLPSDSYYNSVCFGNGKFVTISSNKAAYSTDGINWENAASFPSSSGWESVCFGGGKFVAVKSYWDWDKKNIAYSTDGINWKEAIISSAGYWYSVCYGDQEPTPGYIQFSSSSVTSNIKKIPITSSATFVFTPDQITGESNGNYYVEFEMENLKLISAEITNRSCGWIVEPISTTYIKDVTSSSTETDSINFSSGSTSGSNGYLSYSDHIGSTTYDSSGRKCSSSATGRLYFPYKGTVTLTVAPAKERSSIHFYNDNNISDVKVGDNQVDVDVDVDVDKETTFKFSGGLPPSGSYKDISSSRGPNFGHNLSIYKVKYECTGCYISSATLTNQYLRDYIGSYGRDNATSYKQLILSDGSLASKYSSGCAYTAMQTFEDLANAHPTATTGENYENCSHYDHRELWNKFRDYPAVQIENLSTIKINHSIEQYISSEDLVDTYYRYRYDVYGLYAPYTIYSCSYHPNKNTEIKFKDGNYNYDEHVFHVSMANAKGWGNLDIPISERPYSHINNSAYSYQDISKHKDGYIIQTYWKNGREFELESPTEHDSLPSDFDSNKAIYLAKLDSDLSSAITAGHYICFFGDGNLTVTVTPLQPKIEFTDIRSEEIVTDEKTYTFSADQFSGKSGGQYYIEFDMSNIRLISANITCPVTKTSKTTKTVADVIDFSNGNKTSKNTLQNSSTNVLTTTISGSNDNGLYKVTSQTEAKIYSKVKGSLKLKVYYLPDGYVDLKLSNTAGVAVARYDESQGQEIEIPDDFIVREVVPDVGSLYSVTLDLSNVYILNAVLTDWSPSYSDIFDPERSSVVNFSRNTNGKPNYKSSIIIYGQDTGGNISDQGIKWDSSLNSWTSRKIHSYNNINDGKTGWNHVYYQKGRGDFFGLFEDIGTKPSKLFVWNNSDASDDTGHYNRSPYATGLTRIMLPLEKQENDWTRFDVYGSGVGARLKYLMIGATLPINLTLFAGVSDSETLHYQWQSDNNGNIITYDATEAVKKVTKDACTKLKGDWGSDLRIYLIKYRKQTQYKKAFNQGNANFDYSYLNNCASGTSEPYLFENVTSQSELNTALQKIYENIKTWAGRTEAKLVEKPRGIIIPNGGGITIPYDDGGSEEGMPIPT